MSNKEHEKQANELMVSAIIKALKRANIPVIKASDDLAEILQMAGLPLAYKKKEAPETASGFQRNHHPTVVSSADGANILKNIDNIISEYKEKSSHSKTFIGNVARALKAKRDGSGSEYATFITSNNKMINIRVRNHNATVINNKGNAHIVGFH